jgi:tRNA 2-selenouridine synthase
VYEMPTELDLETLPFSAYDLIIDARTEREYADDHIPGAINLPALSEDEYAEVGEMVRSQSSKANAIGVSAAMKRVGDHVAKMVGKPTAKLALVYCLRGGKRSLVWASALRAMDVEAKILPGGWKSYRKWAVAGLDNLSRYFEYRLLAGPFGSGQEQLLRAIAAEGGQILDLGKLGARCGMPLSSLSAVEQPKQRLFESMLLETMRDLSLDKPVWVVNWGERVGSLKVPATLRECLKLSRVIELEASPRARVELLTTIHGVSMEAMPVFLKRMRRGGWGEKIGESRFSAWDCMCGEQRWSELTQDLLGEIFDPLYEEAKSRLARIEESQVVVVENMHEAWMRATARMLIQDNHKVAIGRLAP